MRLAMILIVLFCGGAWAQCPPQDSWDANPPADAAVVMTFNDGSIRDLSASVWPFSNIWCSVQNSYLQYTAYSNAELKSWNTNRCGLSSNSPKTAVMWIHMDIPGNEDAGDKGGNFVMGKDSTRQMFSSYNFIRVAGTIIPDIGASGWDLSGGDRTIYTGVWHHIVAQYEPGYLRMYLDGEINKEIFNDGYTLNVFPSTIRMGVDWWGRNFYGKQDNIAFYDRILSYAEINDLYQSGRAEGK